MQRLKIELPETLEFRTGMDVRIGDVNYGGHLGNAAVLVLLQEARLRFLARDGFSEKEAGGCGLIQADAAIQYLSQAFHGEALQVEVGVGESDRLGFEFLYRIRSGRDGREIARARTGMLFYDYVRGRITRRPDVFREKVLERRVGTGATSG
jgi:acyl-CoA thioesterase FadM